MRQLSAGRVCLEFGKGARHALERQLVQLFDGWMGQQRQSPRQSMVVAGAADIGMVG